MSNAHRIRINDELSLSPMVENDRECCVELINDPAVAAPMLRVPHPYGPEDFDNFLDVSSVAAGLHNHPLHFGIHHDGYGLIGGFGFEALALEHCVEIGYWLGHRFWGKGIMPMVVDAAFNYAVRTWDVVRVTAHVFTTNPASARVLEKVGFQYEGLLRKKFRKQGEFIDAKLYARVVDSAE